MSNNIGFWMSMLISQLFLMNGFSFNSIVWLLCALLIGFMELTTAHSRIKIMEKSMDEAIEDMRKTMRQTSTDIPEDISTEK